MFLFYKDLTEVIEEFIDKKIIELNIERMKGLQKHG
jgi:hypothetical protein